MSIQNKKIIFTGGGTAGHVIPNIALIEKFNQEGWETHYIGSKKGIEKELISRLDIPYHTIATGKLRRYFSWKNLIDPYKIIYGIIQAIILCLKIKPKIMFSKGGFVSFPVVVAAKFLRIPIIVHESDLTIGLANKLSFALANKICVSFPETKNQIKNKNNVIVTGLPVRNDLLRGQAELGKKICDFAQNKKIIAVFGGSLGSNKINLTIREILPELLEQFQIIHICGKNKIDNNYNYPGYKQFEYIDTEFPHILAASDLVISRAGANTIYELLALRKPNILLPLSKNASRGDQIMNAEYCIKRGFSEVIHDHQLSKHTLLKTIENTFKNSGNIIKSMENFEMVSATDTIYSLVD